jgi:predicted nucleic acid-binding protein
MSVIVSDTSPLHYLILCEAEAVLPRLFQKILIPPTVFAELTHPNAPPIVEKWAHEIPSWIAVQKPATLDHSLNLDRGEIEAVCLARETKAPAILIDDLKGRNAALRCGLLVTGTIGVLDAAAARGWIDLPAAMARLRRTNMRLDPVIIALALERDRARRRD